MHSSASLRALVFLRTHKRAFAASALFDQIGWFPEIASYMLIEFVLYIGNLRKLDRQRKTQLVCDIGSMFNMYLITTGTVNDLGAYSLWKTPLLLSDEYIDLYFG